MREAVACANRRSGVTCGTVLGELVNGRLEVTRLGLIARGGEISITCRRCGQTVVIDLAPTTVDSGACASAK